MRRKNVSSRARSCAEQSPDHAGAQYTSAMTVAPYRNTSWSELAGSPWSWRTRSTYSDLEHNANNNNNNNNNNTSICKAHIVSIRAESEAPNTELTWSSAVNLLLIMTLSQALCFSVLGRMSSLGAGSRADLSRAARSVLSSPSTSSSST